MTRAGDDADRRRLRDSQVSHSLKLGSEIRRSRTVQTPVNEDSEFVIDPLRHTEPMEIE